MDFTPGYQTSQVGFLEPLPKSKLSKQNPIPGSYDKKNKAILEDLRTQ